MPSDATASTTVSPAGSTRSVDEDASEILEQRRASERYFQSNYYEEWAEIYRNMKARVEPRVRRNDKGEEVEDESKSNVCLPDHHVMVRRGTARLTRNSPNLRLRGANQQAANKAAALLMYQWDRSESQRAFRKVVRCTKALGLGCGKSYYDNVIVTREFRRLTERLTRPELMQHEGAGDDEIQQAVSELGGSLAEGEVTTAVAKYGNEVTLNVDVKKYRGPVLAYVFVGDVFPEPGFYSFGDSAYIIENAIRDEQWLEYWTKQTSTDPETGQELPVVDPKKAAELLEMAGDRNYLDQKSISLRRTMREAVGIADPMSAGKPIRPPRKRFMIDERHSFINGHLAIDFVGEEGIYLGRLWYPWNTYGKYIYNDMVLIPDLFEGIGDSTPRITRFLMQLRNTRANQTTDFINNKLLPLLKWVEGDNLTDNDLVRTGYARILPVKNQGEAEFLQDPMFPPEAFQDQAQYTREMQQADPSIADFAPGSPTVPEAGKLATSLILQKKGGDDVLADELNELGDFVRRVDEIHLCFNQQAMEDAVEFNSGDYPRIHQVVEGMSLRTPGANPRTIRIDPMDIQEEFEILPEEGSTLADDDEYRLQKVTQGFMLASQNPDVLNKRAFATALVEAMPGIAPEQAINPPAPPPGPPIRVNLSVTAKFEMLPTDVQMAILQGSGLPSEGASALGAVKHGSDMVKQIGEAADAAAKLHEPVNDGSDQQTPGMKAMETKVGS